MSKASADKHQLNLGAMLLAKETQPEAVRPKCTQPAERGDINGRSQSAEARGSNSSEATAAASASTQAHVLAAELFDEALKLSGLSTSEVAYLFGISESVVRRMRSKDARERVSFSQMLRLPPSFHIAMHRVMNKRFGFARAALADLLEAAGALALAVQE